ncbi:MAG: hypothetical protein ACK55I_44060, partial [bacterium]
SRGAMSLHREVDEGHARPTHRAVLIHAARAAGDRQARCPGHVGPIRERAVQAIRSDGDRG